MQELPAPTNRPALPAPPTPATGAVPRRRPTSLPTLALPPPPSAPSPAAYLRTRLRSYFRNRPPLPAPILPLPAPTGHLQLQYELPSELEWDDNDLRHSTPIDHAEDGTSASQEGGGAPGNSTSTDSDDPKYQAQAVGEESDSDDGNAHGDEEEGIDDGEKGNGQRKGAKRKAQRTLTLGDGSSTDFAGFGDEELDQAPLATTETRDEQRRRRRLAAEIEQLEEEVAEEDEARAAQEHFHV